MVWLKRLGIGVFSIFLVVVAVGALRTPAWSLEVTQEMTAPMDVIHQEVSDFRNWKRWAGWSTSVDPDAEFTFTGAARGEGAAWSWKGPLMGQGRMVITKADPKKGIWFDEAIESEEFNASGSITYTDLGEGKVKVTWRDQGRLPPVIGGLVALTVTKALHAHFTAALEELKSRVESQQARLERLPKVVVHGSLHAVTKARDWSAKVDLADLSTVRTIGVGMLEGLKGTVTFVEGGAWMAEVVDGKIADRVTAEPTGEAAMMVFANVNRWRASAISKEVSFTDLGAQIAARMSQVGLPMDRPTPFRLRGEIVNAVWHVVDGSQIDEEATTRAAHIAGAQVQTRSRVKVDVVGFYAPKSGGVITDHGADLIAHIVVPIERVSGHLDAGMIQPLSVLLLPDPKE